MEAFGRFSAAHATPLAIYSEFKGALGPNLGAKWTIFSILVSFDQVLLTKMCINRKQSDADSSKSLNGFYKVAILENVINKLYFSRVKLGKIRLK